MTGQKPIAKFKAGMVSVAIWENQIEVKGKTVTMLKATVQRRYKDKNGDCHFYPADCANVENLPLLHEVMHEWTILAAKSQRAMLLCYNKWSLNTVFLRRITSGRCWVTVGLASATIKFLLPKYGLLNDVTRPNYTPQQSNIPNSI